jgi:hypothetical protein
VTANDILEFAGKETKPNNSFLNKYDIDHSSIFNDNNNSKSKNIN